mmetsp:Transcript_13390/g.39755  ORF Transcript_13390/g.39755 Transcript_13390/m.39755 type:complete len:229 (+) Transcript_13390:144-830(+)
MANAHRGRECRRLLPSTRVSAGGSWRCLRRQSSSLGKSSRLRISSRLSVAHSPPHSSITSCHSGLGRPRHCFSATGRAHATARHTPSPVVRPVWRPRNQRNASGEARPAATASMAARSPPVKMRVPGDTSTAPSSDPSPCTSSPPDSCSDGPPKYAHKSSPNAASSGPTSASAAPVCRSSSSASCRFPRAAKGRFRATPSAPAAEERSTSTTCCHSCSSTHSPLCLSK